MRYDEAERLARALPPGPRELLLIQIARAQDEPGRIRRLLAQAPPSAQRSLEALESALDREEDPDELATRLADIRPQCHESDLSHFYLVRARISSQQQDDDRTRKDLDAAWDAARTRASRWAALTAYAALADEAQYEAHRSLFLDQFGHDRLPLAYVWGLMAQQADVLQARGDDASARLLWVEAASLAGGARAEQADLQLGDIAFQHGDPEGAQKWARQALAAVTHRDPEAQIPHLLRCARALYRYGDRSPNLASVERLLLSVAEPRARLHLQNLSSRAFANCGRSRDAVRLANGALALATKIGDLNEACQAIDNRLQAHWGSGELKAAEADCRDGLALQPRDGPTLKSYAQFVNALGNLLTRHTTLEGLQVLQEGAARESRPGLRAVLLQTELRFAVPDYPAQANQAFTDLRQLLPRLSRGSRTEALHHLLANPVQAPVAAELRKALELDDLNELHGLGAQPSRRRVALLQDLASLHAQVGQRVEELDFLLQAFEVARSLKDPQSIETLTIAVAQAYLQRKDYDAVLALDVSSLRPVALFQLQGSRADAMVGKGDLEGAASAYRAAKSAALRSGRADDLTGALLDEINLLMRLHHLEEADQELEQLLAHTRTSQSASFRARQLARLASVRQLRGKTDSARELWEQSVSASLVEPEPATVARVAGSYADFLSPSDWMAAQSLLERSLAVVSPLPRSQAALAELVAREARLWVEHGQGDRCLPLLQSYHTPEVLALLRKDPMVRKAPQLASWLIVRAETPEGAPDLASTLDQIRLQSPAAGRMLSLRSTNLASLQTRLLPKQLLVCYYPVGDALWIIGLRHDRGFSKKVDLPALRLQELCSLWRRSASQPGAVQTTRTQTETLLHDLLVGPVEGWIPAGGSLLVVPTGPLWYVPLGALRNSAGQWLADRYPCSYLSSGDLLRMADGSWHPYRLGKALALGAPADLPEAAGELRFIATLLPGCALAEGERATRQTLTSLASGLSLLHLATHGHNASGNALDSYLQLADGKLTVPDIQRLKLAPGCLVVLSACESGLGQDDPDSEPVSLATAMTDAGASTVISGLWQVDDAATALLFDEFYRRLKGGATPMRALQEAQAACRRKYPAPFYWAGFTLLGCPD